MIGNGEKIMAVWINGKDLTVEQVISVCRHNEKVELTPEAKAAVKKARNYIEKKLEEKVEEMESTNIDLGIE